jgi:hypothetical protein
VTSAEFEQGQKFSQFDEAFRFPLLAHGKRLSQILMIEQHLETPLHCRR